MKKILAGMFFRLFKGFEIYALIAALVLASSYLLYRQFDDENVIRISRNDGSFGITLHSGDETKELNVTKNNIKQFQFASMDVSAFDAYRIYMEKLPDDVYKKLDDNRYVWYSEVEFLFRVLGSIHYLPAILIGIFIAFFFGRLFKDGTVKNLIASGHSKVKIFLSCFIISVILDFFMLLISIGMIAVFCKYYLWEPPVYLPVVLAMLVIEILLLIFVSAVCIAALFISKKGVVAIVAAFIVCVSMYIPLVDGIAMTLMEDNTLYDSPEFDRYIEIVKNEGRNAVQEKFDYKNLSLMIYYQDEVLHLNTAGTMPSAEKNFLLFLVYSDPFLITHFREMGIAPYMYYRDGLMAINITSMSIYTVIAVTLGCIVFKKREIA